MFTSLVPKMDTVMEKRQHHFRFSKQKLIAQCSIFFSKNPLKRKNKMGENQNISMFFYLIYLIKNM